MALHNPLVQLSSVWIPLYLVLVVQRTGLSVITRFHLDFRAMAGCVSMCFDVLYSGPGYIVCYDSLQFVYVQVCVVLLGSGAPTYQEHKPNSKYVREGEQDWEEVKRARREGACKPRGPCPSGIVAFWMPEGGARSIST